MKKLRLRDWLPITLYFMFGLGLLLYFRMSGMLEQFDIQALSDWVRDQGLTGMLLYVLAYTVRPLVFFPASLLTVFGGYTYGPWLGTLLDVIGAGTGGLLSFWIARLLGRRGVEKLIGKGKLNVLDERIATNGFLVVLIVRLIPLFPFDAISYASGLSKIFALNSSRSPTTSGSSPVRSFTTISAQAFVIRFPGNSSLPSGCMSYSSL